MLKVSVVIPTFQREQVLIETLCFLLALRRPPDEVLVVDQTKKHQPDTENRLTEFENERRIRWLKLPEPSIPCAMNMGLAQATNEIVLFLDDDIIPQEGLVDAHAQGHHDPQVVIVAGQIIQPWQEPLPPTNQQDIPDLYNDPDSFRFNSSDRQWIVRAMAGNMSVKKSPVMDLGGFDENFEKVAYRFEAELSDRVIASGGKIFFDPRASIHHLKADSGGVRAFGHHQTTVRPNHTVGEYYYLLRSRTGSSRWRRIADRLLKSICTRHHFNKPWWIPATIVAELSGFIWACALNIRGPRYIHSQAE